MLSDVDKGDRELVALFEVAFGGEAHLCGAGGERHACVGCARMSEVGGDGVHGCADLALGAHWRA